MFKETSSIYLRKFVGKYGSKGSFCMEKQLM